MPEFRAACRSELQNRQISALRMLALRLVTAGGLWWNIFWWEWGILDGRDIAFGWMSNVVVLAALTVGFCIHWTVGVLTLAVFVPLVRKLTKYATAAWKDS